MMVNLEVPICIYGLRLWVQVRSQIQVAVIRVPRRVANRVRSLKIQERLGAGISNIRICIVMDNGMLTFLGGAL